MTDDLRIRGRGDLEDYLAAFNGKDYDRQIAYYAPDVLYKVGTLTLDAPEKIKIFYADFHEYVDEHVRIVDFLMEGDTAAVSMPSVFRPFRTYEKHGLSFIAGEERRFVSFIIYRLEAGKIRRIQVARYNGAYEDFA